MKRVSYRDYSSDDDDDEDDITDAQRQLFAMCQCGYRERAIKLLKQGVDPNFFIHGEAPLHVATKANHVGILAALLVAPSGGSNVGAVNNLDGIENHRRLVADASARDMKYGWTAIHWAVSMGNLEALSIISYLCPKDVMHAVDRNGRTALQLAQDMVFIRKENSSSILYPYLSLGTADAVVSILSDFCSDRQSRDGRLSRSASVCYLHLIP